MIPPLTAIAAGLLCVILPLLSWFHGGATAGGRTLAQLAALGAFALAILAEGVVPPWRRLRGPLVVLLGLALLALFQAIPLPGALAAALAPERVAAAGSAAVEAAGVGPAAVPLSLAPGVSRRVAVDLLCLAASLVAAAVVFGHRRRRRWLVVAALAAALVQMVVGAGPLMARKVPRLVGSFANPDHVAMTFEIAAALGLAVIAWLAVSRRWTGAGETRLLALALSGAVLLLILLGLALTGSRAGLLACAAGLALEIGWLLRRDGPRRPALVAGTALVLVAVVLGWIGAERTLGRALGTTWYDSVAEGRLVVWREALPLTNLSPWLGTGLGAFRESFALVQESGVSRVTWAKAHNDYLELILCGGVVGVAVLLIGGALTLREITSRLGAAGTSEQRLFVVGVLGALTSVAVHELLDFALTLPANSMLTVVLLGAALAVGGPRSRRAQNEDEGK